MKHLNRTELGGGGGISKEDNKLQTRKKKRYQQIKAKVEMNRLKDLIHGHG
jgi:hypothetical protein